MIRPTFLSFETAKKAIAIGQLGLDTVGHNISNAKTPGYTRQRVDQVSISSSGYSTKYQTFGVQFPGQGADINAISQIRDPYLDNRYRTEAAINGELGAKQDGLTAINNIFDEILSDGLHSKLGQLIGAIDIFAMTPDSESLGMVVRNTADQLLQILNKNATDLENSRILQKSTLTTTVAQDVNSIIEKIAELNVKIKEDNFYGNPSNELNDERNLLIDRLSEYMDIKVVRTPVKIAEDLTIERLSIEIKDSGDPSKGIPNVVLVDSGSYNKLGVTEDPVTGNVAIKLLDGISGAEIDLDEDRANGINGDITNKLFTGALKGYLDIINGNGPNVSSGNTYRGIPYYQAALDEFAQKFAEIMNRVNNISAQEAASGGGTVTETLDKNLFTPLYTTLLPGSPDWIDSILPGKLEFSGNVYDIAFDTTSSPPEITATIGGTIYKGTPDADGKIKFTDADGAVAFTVNTNSNAISDGTARLDATITARNISISASWFENSLYMTATKFDPVDKAAPKLTATGTLPAWLKSVENPAGMTVKDGSYLLKENAGRIEVTIDGVTYYAADPSNTTVPRASATPPLNKNTRYEFVDENDETTVGLIITTSDKPALDSDATKNIVNVKNDTGALGDNLLKFKEALKASNNYFVSGLSGGFESFLTDLQAQMGGDKEINEGKLDASFIVISSLADQRDGVSAVNVDEEGINMMQYQNFYNAAARYMTTLDEALDKIINGMGVVGR